MCRAELAESFSLVPKPISLLGEMLPSKALSIPILMWGTVERAERRGFISFINI